MARPDVSTVQANTAFPEDALIIVYSSLDNLSFRSSMVAIDKQNYNSITGRYELLIKPIKQMVFVGKPGFLELKLNTLNPSAKDVIYYKVEEKTTVLFNQSDPGKLTINSNPAGANISLNGISITNKTPFMGELNPGRTRIQLSKIKYQTFDTLLNVQSSRNEVLTFNLKPLDNLADDFQVDGIVKDVSGNLYKTVKIGDQIWMAENLKTERYANGDLISNVKDDSEMIILNTGAWCNYDNSTKNDEIYGKLYNWNAVADSRNVCPVGWHAPTIDEWTILSDYLGGKNLAGGKMKSTDTSLWESPNINATNESGFSGLPGGLRLPGGVFIGYGSGGLWLTQSEFDETKTWVFGVESETGQFVADICDKSGCAMSIRCLKN